MFTEIVVVIVTLLIIHFSRIILQKLLTDEETDALFFEDLQFNRKIQWEKDQIVNNLMYIWSVVLMILLRIVVPFSQFKYCSWFMLYVLVQTFMLVFQHTLSRTDKTAAAVVCVLFCFFPSSHLNQLILYSLLHFDPLVKMDKQLFGKKAFLQNYHSLLCKLDTVLFFLFWPLTLYCFVQHVNVIDSLLIPFSFYFQLFQSRGELLQNKKQV